MFEKNKVYNDEGAFFAIHALLNTKLQGTTASYQDGEHFYKEYTSFISKLTGTFEALQIYYQQNRTIYTNSAESSKNKEMEDLEFIRNAEGAIRARAEELVSKQNRIEDIKRRMRVPVEAIDYKKVAKFDVQDHESLNNFFTVFFQIYYGDSRESFDWKKFKKQVVVKEKLKDFQARLMNADYTNFTPEQIDTLVRLCDDPEIAKLAKDKKLGGPIINLLTFLGYVGDLAKTQEEIQALQYEICVIQYDTPKRGGRARIEAQKIDVKQENIAYLEDLNNKFLETAKVFGKLVEDTDGILRDFKEERKKVGEVIEKEYSKILQYVPESVYELDNGK